METTVNTTTVSTLLSCKNLESFQATQRKAFGWNISWLPAFTLFVSDTLSWPAIFLFLSQLRLTFLGSPGQLEWQILVIPALVTAVVLHMISGYDRRTDMVGLGYSVQHILGLLFAFVIAAFALYGIFVFGDLVKPSRFIFLITFPIFGTYTLFIRRWLTGALNRHHSRRNFVLIADPKSAASFYNLYRTRRMRQELRIYASDSSYSDLPVLNEAGPRFMGDLNEALADLDQNSDGVIVGIPPSKLDPNLAQILAYVHFRHIPVYTLESFYEQQWRQVPVQDIEAWWAFARESLLARDSIYDNVKRLVDSLVALTACIILTPLLLVIGLLVRFDSTGPAIFRQTRIGRVGRPFTLFKFRTMRIGSDSGGMYTTKKDARITRIGKFLRLTRLDELPQLINVLRGDMSIIGPRAEWNKCVERYEGQIPFYSYRHLVRPGITGWAQVNYPYGENDADALEKLKFDLYYIRNYSLTLDLAIALKTIHVMLFAKGR